MTAPKGFTETQKANLERDIAFREGRLRQMQADLAEFMERGGVNPERLSASIDEREDEIEKAQYSLGRQKRRLLFGHFG